MKNTSIGYLQFFRYKIEKLSVTRGLRGYTNRQARASDVQIVFCQRTWRGCSTTQEINMEVQAAAISRGGNQFVVVVVGMDLVENAGEGDMAIDTMQGKFGGASVVLMAQSENGSPRYYGDQDLVESLRGLALEKMPWQAYSI
jgi:hypothetical protein